MAFCNAGTVGNPRAAAAALRPPNCTCSAVTLWPKQFAFPGVPANAGLAYTHAAPIELSSSNPPAIAVFPSLESETEKPCCVGFTAPVPTSLAPCWVHTPPERVYTHAAPAELLSTAPPTTAVFPSPESATESPCSAPTAPVPTSLAPCCVHTPPHRVYTHA